MNINSTKKNLPFIFPKDFHEKKIKQFARKFNKAYPFQHIVIDNFLPESHANFLHNFFPTPNHPIWLDWKKRTGYQYGKLGIGNADNFNLLDPMLRLALLEFNSSYIVNFLEQITGIKKIIPDPHFSGGGMHQILNGGILDIHTDFNDYKKMDIFRQINMLLYLNKDWKPEYCGELELWDDMPKKNGRCIKKIEPIFNRCVIFKTDKTSFHGHPTEWNGGPKNTRKSIAMYYYTSKKIGGGKYDARTDFQGVNKKNLPAKNHSHQNLISKLSSKIKDKLSQFGL